MNTIKNTDVQALRDVAKSIEVYAEGIKNDINKLCKRHADMNGAWNGKQYNQLTDILQEAQKNLVKQAAILKEISSKVSDDANRLAAAQSATIK